VHGRRRRRAFAAAAERARLQAFLVSAPRDVAYLSGFGGEDSWLLLGEGWACLLTDGRFAEQAAGECPGLEVYVRSGPMPAAVATVLRGRRVRSVGFQAHHLTVAARDGLAEALGGRRLRPVAGVVAELRLVKDAGEVRRIRRAVGAAERAFRGLIAGGADALAGRTEADLAAELDGRMRQAGASGPAFETIVAAGPHASRPHHVPGGRRVRRGEAVLIDWGARVDGYVSDLTRVVFVHRIPPALAEVYDVVRRSQRAGIAAVRPRARCRSIDAAARDVIERAGHGERFVHGLGHGIGLDVHEGPGLHRRNDRPMRSGMVVTVEPGVYLPGVGGVRIEDDVLVTGRGGRRLSSLPTSPEAVTLR